jgi:peptidyl-prolyl cis-trans isomerase D
MRSHKFFTVFLLGVITIVITIAFVFYGIGPQQNPSNTILAQVGKRKITLAEYERAYSNAYRRAWDTYKNEKEIEKLNLRQKVLDELINDTIFLYLAEKIGIKVSEEELQEAIVNEPAFQVNGVFNRAVYERRLKLNRLTPAAYENSVRTSLLLTKVHRIISETAELSPDEEKTLNSMKENRQQLEQVFLFSKRQFAVKAYLETLKRRMKITVNKDFF